MKSGFVTLFGRSNTGKSTLLNRLVGTKLAITSPKPQTTRQPLQGVLHLPEGQIVFVDTPGFFLGARSSLTKRLNQFAEESVKDVNVIVHLLDPTRAMGPEDKRLFSMLRDVKTPKLLVLNKCDTKAPYRETFLDQGEGYQGVLEVSALRGTHMQTLVAAILDLLPEGDALYPEGQLTNISNHHWFAELIREKLFLRLREEAPYALTVVVDDIERRENGMLYISARILVSNDRYKGIVIGAGGRGLKEVGQSTRRELEQVVGSPVYLDIQVEVDPHWMARLDG